MAPFLGSFVFLGSFKILPLELQDGSSSFKLHILLAQNVVESVLSCTPSLRAFVSHCLCLDKAMGYPDLPKNTGSCGQGHPTQSEALRMEKLFPKGDFCATSRRKKVGTWVGD